MTEPTDKLRKVAMGAMVGAAAGFVAGVLLAPKSGKETREDLKNSGKKLAHEADRHAKRLLTELSDTVDKATSELSRATDQVKEELGKQASRAVRSRDQLATVMTAVRSGNSSDEDLDIAVKNAQNALDSLRKYLKK